MDPKIELTDRNDDSKKKKLTEIKRKQHQNYTVMTYIGHRKKRQSKDKNQLKKTLLAFSDQKKMHLLSGLKQREQSEKKINKSIFSV